MAKKERTRNMPCGCGSGKKTKLCCGKSVNRKQIENDALDMAYYQDEQVRQQAELLRWNRYAETNPEAEPGDTLLQYARRWKFELKGKLPPAPPPKPIRQSPAMMELVISALPSYAESYSIVMPPRIPRSDRPRPYFRSSR